MGKMVLLVMVLGAVTLIHSFKRALFLFPVRLEVLYSLPAHIKFLLKSNLMLTDSGKLCAFCPFRICMCFRKRASLMPTLHNPNKIECTTIRARDVNKHFAIPTYCVF